MKNVSVISKKINISEDLAKVRFEKYFDIFSYIFCVANFDGYFVQVNSSFEKILGYEKHELTSSKFYDFIHPDDILETTLQVENIKRNIPLVDFTNRYRAKNGRYIYILWSAVLSDDGMIYAVGHDTTNLIETQNNLRSAHLSILNQQQALDCSAIVAETDLQGRIVYVNDKFVEISKYSREELIGQDHRILNSGHHPKAFFQDLWETISNGEIFYGEIKNRAKDGSYYWVDTTIYPVKDENNKPRGYVAIRFDITDKKVALEDLQLAKEKAIVADQAKSDFLYTMSHEIRTPVNGIIGMASLLLETSLTAEQRECAETITQSSKTLLSIINDILDFSKIEADKIELEEVEFNFNHFIHDLMKPFYHQAQKKNIFLKLICPDLDKNILGDYGRLGQVITNLISNALKFTKIGGIILNIKFKEEVDGYVEIKISVSDTGIGIPEESKSRMFKAFSQADKSTSRKYGGTGLGLMISKKLVEKMHGQISFESEVGLGTTFHVVIKMKYGSSELIPLETLNEAQSMIGHFRGRILVAEDNPTNQLVISRILDKWDCKYHIVANGHEVLDALREATFDLILMDCQMPEMDGYEATRIIRASQGSFDSKIPIIALTANAVRGDEQKCRQAGMNDYLSKPLDKDKLRQMLYKYLEATFMPLAEVDKKPLFDENTLKRLESFQKKNQDNLIVEIIDSFENTTQDKIRSLALLLKENKIDEFKKGSHSLRSSALMIGCLKLAQICEILEEFPFQDVCKANELFKKMCLIYQETLVELRNYLRH